MSKAWIRLLLVGTVILGCPTLVQGQLKSTAIATAPDESFPKFAYSTSIGFSFSGPVYSSEFKLMDELGFEYDIMSLLKDEQVRQEIGLSDDQLEKMKAIKSEVDNNMGEIMSAIGSEEKRNEVKNRILGAEEVLYNLLEPEQANRLGQLRNQIGIARYGVVPYLSRKSMLRGAGLSDESIEEFQNQSNKLLRQIKSEKEELNKRLNRELMEELSRVKRRKLQDIIPAQQFDKLLQSPLFVSQPVSMEKLSKQVLKLIDVIGKQEIRKGLEVSSRQEEEISTAAKDYRSRIVNKHERLNNSPVKQTAREKADSLRAFINGLDLDFENELEDILSAKQWTQLLGMQIEMEAKRLGTVGAITTGQIAHQLKLNPDETERIYDKGLKLEKVRQKELEQLNHRLRESAYDLFDRRSSKSIADLVGRPADLKMR